MFTCYTTSEHFKCISWSSCLAACLVCFLNKRYVFVALQRSTWAVNRGHIFLSHIYMQPTKMIPKWKPLWSEMILLIIKDDCKCNRWQGFIWSFIAVIFIPWTLSGFFFLIFARSEYFLALWHAYIRAPFMDEFLASFPKIWLWTISDAHALLDFNWFLLFQVFKNTWYSIIAVILWTLTYPLHWLNFFPTHFLLVELIELFFSDTPAIHWQWSPFSATPVLYW